MEAIKDIVAINLTKEIGTLSLMANAKKIHVTNTKTLALLLFLFLSSRLRILQHILETLHILHIA